jgi:preprotein translocase subunit SecD
MLNDKLQPVLTIALDKSGSAAIAKWTEAHAGSPMLVLVSGRFLSMPMISGPLTSGSLQLTGNDDTAVRKLLESESVWAK